MRRALEGSPYVGELPPEMRDYLLAKRFGWTLTEIDEQPTVRCDWLLAIAAVEDEVVAERMKPRS